MSSSYPTLLSPLRVGAVTLRSRVVMSAMHMNLEGRVEGFPRLAAFYRERARAGVGLIVTGFFSPVTELEWTRSYPFYFNSDEHVAPHRLVTDAVHEEGGCIILQLGSPAATSSPSMAVGAGNKNLLTALLSEQDVWRVIGDYALAAERARQAGYDGVEIYGSEGFLLSSFLTPSTNARSDYWGGSLEKRMRMPLEILRQTRGRMGADFLISFRISLLDLVAGASSFAETIELARALERAGVDVLSGNVGWWSSQVPTIAGNVPRGAFVWAAAELKRHVTVPVVASHRINNPGQGEKILAAGHADLIGMGRPLLADPEFVRKAREDRADEINTCVACNQACLDHGVEGKAVGCILNWRAGRETEIVMAEAPVSRRIAVVGAGPAGATCAVVARERGHRVVLFEAASEIGGQLRYAKVVPGKEEFCETLRYLRRRIEVSGVELRLEHRAGVRELVSEGFDAVVLASGAVPRRPDIPGIDHPRVSSFVDVLTGRREVGARVALIGAGPVAVDVALFLTTTAAEDPLRTFFEEWGVETAGEAPGRLVAPRVTTRNAKRSVSMFRRSMRHPLKQLGKTTGWIHWKRIRERGVVLNLGVSYSKIDDAGLHLSTSDGATRVVEADSIVVCAGLEPMSELEAPLVAAGLDVHLIGGARAASELDAARAVAEGTELAITL